MTTDNLAECRRLLRIYWLVVEASKGVELTDGANERFDGMTWNVCLCCVMRERGLLLKAPLRLNT